MGHNYRACALQPANGNYRAHVQQLLKPTLQSLYHAELLQLCLTLCDPMDCSPPGSSVRGILQARILEWIAIPSPGDLPNSRIELVSLTSNLHWLVGSLPPAPPRTPCSTRETTSEKPGPCTGGQPRFPPLDKAHAAAKIQHSRKNTI